MIYIGWKNILITEFEMKDLGLTKRILGIDINRDWDQRTLILSQSSYIKKVIKLYNMTNAKLVNTPMWTYSNSNLL